MKLLRNYRLWQFAFIAMLVPLSLIAFWPTPVDGPIQGLLTKFLRILHRYGAPTWFDYKFVEASANVALFFPLGCVGSLAFPARAWWQVTAVGLVVSMCIEIGQLLFLNNRFASPLDLFTNAFGAALGALLADAALARGRGTSLGGNPK